ncbi:hypothetical protein [Clostridium diolis]|nr:hypothetical protein [Clostridium diolis]
MKLLIFYITAGNFMVSGQQKQLIGDLEKRLSSVLLLNKKLKIKISK